MKNNSFKRSMLIISVFINSSIFLLLSILHFYWAFGGKLWYDDVLPTSTNGLHKLNPSAAASAFIGFGLMILALLTVGNLGVFGRYVKRKYFRYAALTVAIIFLLRAIGDFRFIGFFKTVNRTRFGINDTQIFSPLCLFIAFLSVLIFIFNKRTHNIPDKVFVTAN